MPEAARQPALHQDDLLEPQLGSQTLLEVACKSGDVSRLLGKVLNLRGQLLHLLELRDKGFVQEAIDQSLDRLQEDDKEKDHHRLGHGRREEFGELPEGRLNAA